MSMVGCYGTTKNSKKIQFSQVSQFLGLPERLHMSNQTASATETLLPLAEPVRIGSKASERALLVKTAIDRTFLLKMTRMQ